MILSVIHLMLTSTVTALIIFFALFTQASLPGSWQVAAHGDLLLHAGAFGLLTILVLPATRRILIAVALIIVFATTLEAAQLALPHRTVSALDLLANLAGIVAAWALAAAASALRAPALGAAGRLIVPIERSNDA